MRWFQVLTASLLPFTALAAKKTGDKFADARAKSLEIGRPLKLDDGGYGSLTKGQRDYSVVVLLTALETRFGCVLCREFQPEWDLLGKSWIKGDKAGQSRTLFGTLDFVDGKNTFQSLQLQTAPVLLFFPPTVGPNAKIDAQPVRYDFTSGPQAAEQIHAWVSRQLPADVPKPKISRPINWVKIISVTTAVVGGITALAVASPYVLPLLQNRNLWAAFSLITVLLFTSGHMFNHIRKTPYVQGDGKGGISYFAGGFSNQFGLESQIIAAIYGVLAFATISLALKVPRIADSRAQQFAVFLWSGVLLCMYSFLLSVFRQKNGGYQFWLPPF
ncbi:magnesium transporter protein-like protein 1 precursor [Macroventuria anomochaeta]|uniref:Magnesium transporter protein-like protein 1 n=1 Tax=Macroventuria anomochaeta TaxID=301207 RepID=A0ACB6SEN3_9PLEO|nr:magnesium transporter protein-like protein 1 precursor [Macroventuria anomochaeta]KAF2631552.1 magnesium transporter protein-like protein 1 precursor [Macroventuria anomochaeta]